MFIKQNQSLSSSALARALICLQADATARLLSLNSLASAFRGMASLSQHITSQFHGIQVLNGS